MYKINHKKTKKNKQIEIVTKLATIYNCFTLGAVYILYHVVTYNFGILLIIIYANI